MSYDFNADEIFEMAEQIERNGAIFYRSAAEKINESSQKKLLLDLAAMEDDHEKTFAQFRKQLTEKEKQTTVFDPDNESILYLQSLADMRIFYKKEFPPDDIKEILKAAITAEKDSIVFYLGMKDVVSEKLGKSKIDAIIKEEMGHIRMLSNKLVALHK
ncbi:MAG: ferritin family protein [Desulfobacterales bacterium]|nr:ferritin family protein [Desulfobacterales bacterium]